MISSKIKTSYILDIRYIEKISAYDNKNEESFSKQELNNYWLMNNDQFYLILLIYIVLKVSVMESSLNKNSTN